MNVGMYVYVYVYVILTTPFFYFFNTKYSIFE